MGEYPVATQASISAILHQTPGQENYLTAGQVDLPRHKMPHEAEPPGAATRLFTGRYEFLDRIAAILHVFGEQ